MQLHALTPQHPKTKTPRVGRGGKRGKTAGRGGKGQTARAGHKIRPEVRDLIKKLPKRRGHGTNRSRTVRTNRAVSAVVNFAALEALFDSGATISPATLLAKGLVRRSKGRTPQVKILALGTLSKAFTFARCEISAAAKTAILKAGGTLQEP